MRAYIYAAGRGIRLGSDFEDLPKILINVGGRSVLEWHSIRLNRCGVSEIYVISGYKRDMIQQEIVSIQSKHGTFTQEIYNPSFNEGSVLSFNCSLPSILSREEAVLLMDGDVLYPDAFLNRLIGSRSPSCLLMDRQYSDVDDDPVLAPIRDGAPVDLQKQWKGRADQVGESVGFFKVSPIHFPALRAEIEKRLHGAGRLESYDEVLRGMILAGCFGYEDVSGLPWTELDFPEDVEYAREEIQPRLEAFKSNRANVGNCGQFPQN